MKSVIFTMQVHHVKKGSDKLIQKNRFPYEFKTIDFYEPGRASCWR
jgi:hypothetical protein